MSWIISLLDRTGKQLWVTLRRFPLSSFLAILTTGVAIGVPEWDFQTWPAQLLISGIVFFFAGVLWQLFGEMRKYNRIIHWIGYVVLLALWMWYFWSLPTDFDEAPALLHVTRSLVLTSGLVVLVPWIYVTNKKNNTLFWQHALHAIQRFAISGIFSAAVFLGVALALWACEQLLGVDWYNEIYIDFWMFAVGVFGTLFFLWGLPELPEKCDYAPARFLDILFRFIALPLVGVYTVILYIYTAQVLLTGVWPQGEVIWLMFALIAIGFGTIFFLFPKMRESTSWFGKIPNVFFVLVLPLMIMYFLAISIRVDEYGWTANRYIVTVFGVWFSFNAIYFLLTRGSDLRKFALSFALLVVVSLFLPFGNMFHLSIASQMGRLEDLLAQNQMIQDGKYIASPEEIVGNDAYAIDSMISSIVNYGGAELLKSKFQTPSTTEITWDAWQQVMRFKELLNVIESAPYSDPRQFNFHRSNNSQFAIDGFAYMYRVNSWSWESESVNYLRKAGCNLTLHQTNQRQIGTITGQEIYEFYQGSKEITQDISRTFGDTKIKLILESISGNTDGPADCTEITDFNGWLLVNKKL